jgi:hypothetical protein
MHSTMGVNAHMLGRNCYIDRFWFKSRKAKISGIASFVLDKVGSGVADHSALSANPVFEGVAWRAAAGLKELLFQGPDRVRQVRDPNAGRKGNFVSARNVRYGNF